MRSIRLVLDFLLYGLLLFLLSYPVTRGLLRHGLMGALFLLLALVHQFLNAGWYLHLFRGRFGARRLLLSLVDFALIFSFLLLCASSLAMSGEVFSFLPFPMTSLGRDLHTSATYWTFALVGLHLGLHGDWLWKKVASLRLPLRLPLLAALFLFSLWSLSSSALLPAFSDFFEREPYPEEGLFFLFLLGSTLFFSLLSRALLVMTGFLKSKLSPSEHDLKS